MVGESRQSTHATDQDVDRLGLRLCRETERDGELHKRGEPSNERHVRVDSGRFSAGLPCTFAPSAVSVANNDN